MPKLSPFTLNQPPVEFEEEFDEAHHEDESAYLENVSEHISLNAESKLSRNDPCPCGSGLKYKQCHGKLT
jgi:preprotein translocase subunit SecA